MSTALQLALPLFAPIAVRCVLVGRRCRVKPCSPGLNQDLNCAFPRVLREPNAVYSVGGISLCKSYYRTHKPYVRIA
jgi:hypothetical protein